MTENDKIQFAKLEKWFSDVHDEMYAEHEKLAKKHDIYCKFFESAMGAHDRAWVAYEYLLYDLGFSFDEILEWRKVEGRVAPNPPVEEKET